MREAGPQTGVPRGGMARRDDHSPSPTPSAGMWHPNERRSLQFGASTQGGEPGGLTTTLGKPKHCSSTSSSVAATKRAQHPLRMTGETTTRHSKGSQHWLTGLPPNPAQSRLLVAGGAAHPTNLSSTRPAEQEAGRQTPSSSQHQRQPASERSLRGTQAPEHLRI